MTYLLDFPISPSDLPWWCWMLCAVGACVVAAIAYLLIYVDWLKQMVNDAYIRIRKLEKLDEIPDDAMMMTSMNRITLLLFWLSWVVAAGSFIPASYVSSNGSWKAEYVWFVKHKIPEISHYWPQAQFLGLPAIQYTAREVRSGLFFKHGCPQDRLSLMLSVQHERTS
jgi:hypothetical protein